MIMSIIEYLPVATVGSGAVVDFFGPRDAIGS